MTILLSGGCKNGKSTLAEDAARALAGDGPLGYIATMIPRDGEDEARVRRHVAARAGKGFDTWEWPFAAGLSGAKPGGTYLLDSVTALLANEMFRDGTFDPAAPDRTERALLALLDTVKNAVLVSDFIQADAGGYDETTEAYRRGLARLERSLAARCDAVGEVCAGCVSLYKGELP